MRYQAEVPENTNSFTADVLDAFVYPVKGACVITLLIGAVFYAITDIFLLGFFVSGYFVALWNDIIRQSAGGKNDMPLSPSSTDIWDDILKPFFASVFAVIFSMLPAILVAKQTGSTVATYIALALGLFYLPMAWLAVVMHNNIMALNPFFVVKAIAKVFGRYLIAVFFMILAFGAIWWLQTNIAEGNDNSLTVAYLGNLLGLYSMIVVMRILGLIYRHNTTELGWFEVA